MSNRLSVLTALDKHGKITYGDLEFNTGLTRKQLLQAVNDAKKVGHILSGKDELTGQPAYTITAKGREWMAAMPQTVEVKLPIPTAVTLPPKLSVVVGPDYKRLAEENHWLFMEAICDLAAISKHLGLDPEECGGSEPIIRSIDSIRSCLHRIGLQLGCEEGELIEQKLGQVMHERIHDKERIHQLEALKVAEITSKQPVGFVVSTPNKPLRRFKNHDTAKTQAMSFARNFGTGEVHALYPVGKAVRGAEWKEQA